MTASKKEPSYEIDWAAIKLEFVNGSMSLTDISEKYQLNGATVRSRAMRDNWQQERNELQQIATKVVHEALLSEKVDKLKELNEVDLNAAKAIRDKANELLSSVATPNELKALSGAFDLAQKISRLALGASTENSTVTNKELPASVDDFV